MHFSWYLELRFSAACSEERRRTPIPPTSASVDLVRKRAVDSTVVPPLSPLRDGNLDFQHLVTVVLGDAHVEAEGHADA